MGGRGVVVIKTVVENLFKNKQSERDDYSMFLVQFEFRHSSHKKSMVIMIMIFEFYRLM